MWLLLFVFILSLIVYIIFTKYKYWERRGVPGPKPFPFIGNIGVSVIGRKNVSEVFADIYHKYENYPFVGIFRMGKPCLLIRDPEIIKNVLIKDVNCFMENDFSIDKELDPLISRNTFTMKGEDWKRGRQFMTPNFASGKIKNVFPVAAGVSRHLITYLTRQGNLAVDAKDAFTKFSCDVIAAYGFGIEGNSFNDPNAELISIARKFTAPENFLQSIKLALAIFMPNVITVKIVPKSFDEGVISLTNATLKYRKENDIRRNDFLDAIANTPSITPIEIAAHMANLIIDGFETTSTAMTFVIYELAANQKCQVTLREEINRVLKKYDDQFSYEAMQEMVYLDACLSEALRLHPTLAQLSKLCNERYTMTSSSNDFNNMSVTLEKGTSIIISLLGLQRNEEYFPSPHQFIPERFLDKTEVNKNVYMPFGSGPRKCIGSRFGSLVVKVGIAQMIKNFEVDLNGKTIHPLKYEPIYFSLYPKGGVWLNCKKIEVAE
nr:cytochrome P450 [Pharsalia antennata]